MFALRKFAPGFVLLLILSAAAPAGAQTSHSAASDLLDSLRERDQVLERIARQMAHPEGVAVDADELRRFSESLQRMELWIGPLSEDHPELAWKHAALVGRARQLVAAASQSRAQNADLVVPDESIRRLNLDEAAFVAVESDALDATQAACDAAPKLGVETRAIPGLDGSREALVRFVAPSDGRYIVDTAGSRTDTRLLVLDGCRGVELARGDDESSLRANAQFSLLQGKEVWIRVGSDRAGHVRLGVEQLSEGVGTASITGTVTAQASGMPIVGLSVRAVSETFGTSSSSTDLSGNFQFTNLPAGTYEVYTRDFNGDWVNEIWDGIECGVGSSACSGLEGDAIVLADAQTVGDIDFSLGRSVVISGKVTNALSGEPISGAEIYAQSMTGQSRYTATDALGRYRFAQLSPGTYFLQASSEYYADELFDDIDCSTGCTITNGTPVEATSDTNVPGIDFELDQVAGILGAVTSVSSGNPVGYEYVYIYDDEGSLVGSDDLNSSGIFFVPIPSPGTYFARTGFSSYDQWVNQMWQGVDCPQSCDLGLATPIVLGDMEVAEIFFTVLRKGGVKGEVTAADGGELGDYYDTRVRLYNDEGSYVGDEYLNQNGDYLIDNLSAGDHYAVATNSEFRSELFDDVACAAGNVCDPLVGTPIAIQFETITPNIDFALVRLGIIEGRVTRTGGASVESLLVSATEASGSLHAPEGYASTAYTDENGDFKLVALEPGAYNVYTSSEGYLDEAFDDLPCEGGCDLSLADEVMVSAIGMTVSGIDFTLDRRAWIEGAIRDASTNQVLEGYVNLYSDDGTFLDSVSTNYSTGKYRFDGLEDGSYYLASRVWSSAYINEIHNDVPCHYPTGSPSCDLMSGDLVPVSVNNGAVVDFELDRGGVIEGSLEDVLGNQIDYATVTLFDAMGNVVAEEDLFFDTSYYIDGLSTGSYYVVTSETNHLDELWPNVPCYGEPFPNCNLNDGTLVSVSLGETTAGIDFVLGELASILGSVVDAESGTPINAGGVSLYNSLGDYVNGSSTNASPFQITEVPPGTYYLRTANTDNYIDAVYGGDLCNSICDPTTGTPIVVGIGDVVSGIEIPLPMGPGIKGRVFDGPTGAPLAGVSIDLWDTGGDFEDSVVTDEDGWYRLPVYYGTYFISTYNDDGLEDFLFDGVPCPDGSAWEGLCDPTTGTPYVIGEYTPLQRLDFVFGDPTVFTDGFESGNTSAWSSTVGAD